jgi:glycosyltransferase involved in cell wall biosynthesis
MKSDVILGSDAPSGAAIDGKRIDTENMSVDGKKPDTENRAANMPENGVDGSVLLVTPWYRPTVGGVVEVSDKLRRLLGEAGVETHLLVCDGRIQSHRIERHASLSKVWILQVPSSAFYRFTPRSFAATVIRGVATTVRVTRFLLRHRIRTVILIYVTECGWPFLLLQRLLKLRLIVSLHGNDVIKYDECTRLSRWFLRRMLPGADRIIVCADHLAGELKKIVPQAELPVRLIPNCVNLDYFTLPPEGFIKPKQPTLVHVSNFAPKKRTTDIIEAFANPAVPQEARLLMVGDGPDLKAAVERARALKVDHRIEFAGAQSDVRPFLWQADIFILASDSEGDPLVLLEAMACGLPWVSTAWGVAASLPKGECGLVVPARWPEKLAAAIAESLSDRDRLLDMGRRSRQRVEAEYGEQKYLERHLQVIREI